jgi:hypothetical protein
MGEEFFSDSSPKLDFIRMIYAAASRAVTPSDVGGRWERVQSINHLSPSSSCKPGTTWAGNKYDRGDARLRQAQVGFDSGIPTAINCRANSGREEPAGHVLHTTIAAQTAHDDPEVGDRIAPGARTSSQDEPLDSELQLTTGFELTMS